MKVVVVGDSYSHCRQHGLTWPDLLQEQLSAPLGREVAVLNLAAGGHGVLQMIDAAARAAEHYRPHVVLVAFISDDLARARWWKHNKRIDSVWRSLLSPTPRTSRCASRATNSSSMPESSGTGACVIWAATTLRDWRASSRSIAQYRAVVDSLWKARDRSPPSIWDLDESVVLNKFLTGIAREGVTYSLPRIRAHSFHEDPEFRDSVQRLQRAGAQLILVHLPNLLERQAGHARLWRTEQSLWRSLEDSVGRSVLCIAGEVAPGEIPTQMDLAPVDPHPSLDGLRFYAEQMAARLPAARLER